MLEDVASYREFVANRLGLAQGKRKRGAVRDVSKALKCHPSFVSQVVRGKAHLSNEQTVRLCTYFGLSQDEADFFFDLVARDRAGDEATRRFFDDRLERRRKARLDLRQRWKEASVLSIEEQTFYYESWVPQALHMLCQLPGKHTLQSVAHRLRLSPDQVGRFVDSLTRLQILSRDGDHLTSQVDQVHLDNDSPYVARSHVNWRLKTANDIQCAGTRMGTHYSSLLSTSRATADRVVRLLVESLSSIRDEVLPSRPDDLYVLAMDFYPFLEEGPG